MKQFTQYNDELQQYIGVLYELNDHDNRLAEFLRTAGCSAKERHSLWRRLAGTLKLAEHDTLLEECRSLDKC